MKFLETTHGRLASYFWASRWWCAHSETWVVEYITAVQHGLDVMETVACALAPISDGSGTELARQVDRPPYLVRAAWKRIDRTTCGGTRAISADVRRGEHPLVRAGTCAVLPAMACPLPRLMCCCCVRLWILTLTIASTSPLPLFFFFKYVPSLCSPVLCRAGQKRVSCRWPVCTNGRMHGSSVRACHKCIGKRPSGQSQLAQFQCVCKSGSFYTTSITSCLLNTIQSL
jgi:hypothetical protein